MRMMINFLKPFTNYFVVVYLDDILIFSKTWDENLQHVKQVLSTLQHLKLYSNREKCSFRLERIQYLVYVVDDRGVHVDPTKIQFIKDWPSPKNIRELHSFLGLENFYHRFVLGCSHLTWPMSQVLKGGSKVKQFWTEVQHRAFEGLKSRLCLVLVLALLDLQQPFEIEMDACDYALGVVLM